MGMQLPLTVGRNVPLPPQVATGAPVKFALQTAVHVCPGCSPLQLGDQLVALPGTGGRVVLEHTAGASGCAPVAVSRFPAKTAAGAQNHAVHADRVETQRQAHSLGPPKV